MQEIANIVSHFIPCCYTVYLMIFENSCILRLYCFTMIISFGTSVIYHTGKCIHCSFSDTLLLSADKIGILILMWGSNLPIIIYGFSSLYIYIHVFLTTAAILYVSKKMETKYFFYLIMLSWIQSVQINKIEIYEILFSSFSVYIIAFVFYSQNYHVLWHLFTALAAFVHYHNLKLLE